VPSPSSKGGIIGNLYFFEDVKAQSVAILLMGKVVNLSNPKIVGFN